MKENEPAHILSVSMLLHRVFIQQYGSVQITASLQQAQVLTIIPRINYRQLITN